MFYIVAVCIKILRAFCFISRFFTRSHLALSSLQSGINYQSYAETIEILKLKLFSHIRQHLNHGYQSGITSFLQSFYKILCNWIVDLIF